MSADTMPCGCLGHTDYEKMCRYPALEVERNSLRARAEQAERERDEARNGRLRDAELLKRVEADNAALSKHIDWACHLLSLGQAERAVSYLRKAASHEHPGAGLLELADAVRQYQHRDETTLLETLRRLMDERSRIAQMRPPEYIRALERVRDAAEPFRSACLHPEPWPGGDSRTELVLSCADVDALKGKR